MPLLYFYWISRRLYVFAVHEESSSLDLALRTVNPIPCWFECLQSSAIAKPGLDDQLGPVVYVACAESFGSWRQTGSSQTILTRSLANLERRIAKEYPGAFYVDVEGCTFGDLDRIADRHRRTGVKLGIQLFSHLMLSLGDS
jgi:hypothetical protein